jgi:neutral ceramidase
MRHLASFISFRPLACLRIACVIVFATTSPALADLTAGAARVSITPDYKQFHYQLGGYVDKQRTGHSATGVHDQIYSRALVVSDGAKKVAVVSLDLCYMPASVKAAVLKRIGATGIPADGLFLSATHTHSAPDPLALHESNTGPAGALPTFDPLLTDWMADHIAQSITDANGRLKAAKIGSGQMQNVGLNRNRRGERITDDEMTALKVTGADGTPIAAVFVYAAHPVYYGPEQMQVSGDWAGTFERQMEAGLDGAPALFLNGAEGDASPHGSDEGLNSEKIEIYSAKICAKARALLGEIKAAGVGAVASWTTTAEMGARIPHPFFILAAGGLRATADQARELVNRVMPDKVEITFVRVGDLLLMGVPGEPTTPIGLEAKRAAREKSVKHPAIVALTNGWIGYIVTPEQYKAGRYEPTMSFYGDQVGVRILAGLKAGLSKLEK